MTDNQLKPTQADRYGFSGVRETIGSHSYVAIIDKEDKDARIAFVPFSNRYPPLKQPDVELIVDALNVRHRLSQSGNAERESGAEIYPSAWTISKERYEEKRRQRHEGLGNAMETIRQQAARIAELEAALSASGAGIEQETLSREQPRDVGQLEAAILDLPFANMAPTEWGDYEWGLLADTLSTPPASPEQPSPSPVTGEAVEQGGAAGPWQPIGSFVPQPDASYLVRGSLRMSVKQGRDIDDDNLAAALILDPALTTDQSQTDRLREAEWLNLMPRELVARAALNEGCRDQTAADIRDGHHRDVKIRAEVAIRLVGFIQEQVLAALGETRP